MHILGLDLLLYSYILLECKLGFNVNNLFFLSFIFRRP